MPSFYNYNKERKEKSFLGVYVSAVFAAFILVFLLIASGYGIRFIISFIIKYYLWVFGGLALIAIAVHFWNKGKRRAEVCEYP